MSAQEMQESVGNAFSVFLQNHLFYAGNAGNPFRVPAFPAGVATPFLQLFTSLLAVVL